MPALDPSPSDRAVAFHGEALALARDAGDAAQIATDLSYLGDNRLRQGHHKEAADCYRESSFDRGIWGSSG